MNIGGISPKAGIFCPVVPVSELPLDFEIKAINFLNISYLSVAPSAP